MSFDEKGPAFWVSEGTPGPTSAKLDAVAKFFRGMEAKHEHTCEEGNRCPAWAILWRLLITTGDYICNNCKEPNTDTLDKIIKKVDGCWGVLQRFNRELGEIKGMAPVRIVPSNPVPSSWSNAEVVILPGLPHRDEMGGHAGNQGPPYHDPSGHEGKHWRDILR